jgi:hypothetical protein
MFVFCKDNLPPISNLFRLTPLEAVNRFAFASQKFSAEDVIAILEAKYSKDETLQETQKMLFGDVLKPILRDWANEDAGTKRSRLHCFVEFCTGQTYLPHPSQPFKIEVIFEEKSHEKDSTDKERLPACYTCINQLCLPEEAYDANREIFEPKLELSVAHCKSFSMH